jgi:5-methylcytosine-specific restriction endonuclease McrA
MSDMLRKLVRRRARSCCEYCGLPEIFAPVVPLHIEHIIPRMGEGVATARDFASKGS